MASFAPNVAFLDDNFPTTRTFSDKFPTVKNLGKQLPLICPTEGRQEPQRGPMKHSRAAPLRRKLLIFLNGTFWCTLYF